MRIPMRQMQDNQTGTIRAVRAEGELGRRIRRFGENVLELERHDGHTFGKLANAIQVVVSICSMTAGPLIWPVTGSESRQYTGVRHHWLSKYTSRCAICASSSATSKSTIPRPA